MKPCKHDTIVNGCRICHLYENDPSYRSHWTNAKDVVKHRCVHLKQVLDNVDASNLPCACVGKWLHSCDLFAECTLDQERHGVQTCRSCDQYKRRTPLPNVIHVGKPSIVGKVNEYFNGSIIEYKGKTLLAYRVGWAGSNIYIVELDAGFQPCGDAKLVKNLTHQRSSHGREDPRLFTHNGTLHLAYTGVMRDMKGNLFTNQMYARLNEEYVAERAIYPHYEKRATWEKNWQFFSSMGELFAIYSIAPHTILHIVGDKAYPFTETKTLFKWEGGSLRGGAPPVMVDNVYYHWFHGRIGQWAKGVYTLGLYTFNVKPPFNVTSMIPMPLVKGDMSTRPKDQSTEPAVIFPAGSIYRDGVWSISSGIHDRWVDIHRFKHSDIKEML